MAGLNIPGKLKEGLGKQETYVFNLFLNELEIGTIRR